MTYEELMLDTCERSQAAQRVALERALADGDAAEVERIIRSLEPFLTTQRKVRSDPRAAKP